VAGRFSRNACRPSSASALRAAGVIYVEGVMGTEDALEGLTAFTQKRPAVWRNR
jgi:hypothetical protein